jgi:nucleoside-diphosphate-sugar epimerase
MKVLFIGGTGIISTACVALAVEQGCDVTVLNRGHKPVHPGAEQILCDVHDEAALRARLSGRAFDVAADFTAFTPEEVARDIRLFDGGAGQYIFISTTAAYQKPLSLTLITESTPQYNPYWQYGRDKAQGERLLAEAYDKTGFPFTAVRPAHTYDRSKIPAGVTGKNGTFQILNRILEGKPVLVHGDGLGWWTMTDSRDFARAFVGLLGNPHAIGEAVHILSDERLTWDQIYDTFGRALGKPVRKCHVATNTLIRFDPDLEGPLLGDKSNTAFYDTTKIKRLVPGWVATIRFDQGIRETIDNIMGRPELQILDPVFDALCDRVVAAVSGLGAEKS